MADVIQIGRCSGCQRNQRLTDEACGDCRSKFGPRCGPIMKRIRTDPAFAKMCYEQFKEASHQREAFEKMFGKPA